jgi:hypothetical protein
LQARIVADEPRVAALAPLETMRRDWIAAKKAASSVNNEQAAEATRQAALYRGLAAELDQAFDISVRCRGMLRDLLTTSPRGSSAGKIDVAAGGILGAVATHYKQDALDRYEALGMLLRQELRALDATPVVCCPELEHYVVINSMGEGTLTMDYAGEFLGSVGALFDAKAAWDTRKPKGRLMELDARLATLQEQLEQRKVDALGNAAAWDAKHDAAVVAA